ncbi:MAG TPA: cupin domain-containing protein [Gaiellaceae bacterium]|nr:cupin domain-containing protein [Gaiellaceae bacterium]
MNLRDCELAELDECPEGFRQRSTSVRPAVGGVEIGCSLYELPPGQQLWPYHWHFGNEEWALVVTGSPTVRTPDGEAVLRAGDVVAFPEGEAGAHTFTNRTAEPTRVAVFSTRRRGDSFYPDSGKVGAGPPWDRRFFRLADAVDYWDGECSNGSST